MERTTRALLVLALVAILVAPLVNGVLEQADATAGRIFLKNTDWTDGSQATQEPANASASPNESNQTEPNQTQTQTNESDIQRNLTGPTQQDACQIEERTVAFWRHPAPDDDTQNAVQNRTVDPGRQTFTVTSTDIGLGVRLQAENVTGVFSASVYKQNETQEPVFQVQKQDNPLPEDLQDSATVRRPLLTNGTWIAELNPNPFTDDATTPTTVYDDLTFIVKLARCSEATT